MAAPAGTRYVHDLNGRLLGEYDAATGAARREYVWLHAMPLAGELDLGSDVQREHFIVVGIAAHRLRQR